MRKKRSRRFRRLQSIQDRCYYGFSWSEMNWNLVLRVEPIRFTVAIITTEMPAARRPYSIAVAPDSSFRNATNFDIADSPRSWKLDDGRMILPPGRLRRSFVDSGRLLKIVYKKQARSAVHKKEAAH